MLSTANLHLYTAAGRIATVASILTALVVVPLQLAVLASASATDTSVGRMSDPGVTGTFDSFDEFGRGNSSGGRSNPPITPAVGMAGRDAQPRPSDWSTRCNHNILVYQYRLCYAQCRCIVPAHYHAQLYSVDQSQEPVAHLYGEVRCVLVRPRAGSSTESLPLSVYVHGKAVQVEHIRLTLG